MNFEDSSYEKLLRVSVENELQKINWTPHIGQKQIIDCQARDIVIAAGRRWGKSAVSAYLILKEFIYAYKRGKTTEKIFIVAPSYELTQKVFEYVIRWILRIEPNIQKKISYRPFPQIKLSEGFWIQCKSAENPQSILGEGVDFLVVDEAAQINRRTYEQYIYPTTSDRKGNASATVRPKSRPPNPAWLQKAASERL